MFTDTYRWQSFEPCVSIELQVEDTGDLEGGVRKEPREARRGLLCIGHFVS